MAITKRTPIDYHNRPPSAPAAPVNVPINYHPASGPALPIHISEPEVEHYSAPDPAKDRPALGHNTPLPVQPGGAYHGGDVAKTAPQPSMPQAITGSGSPTGGGSKGGSGAQAQV